MNQHQHYTVMIGICMMHSQLKSIGHLENIRLNSMDMKMELIKTCTQLSKHGNGLGDIIAWTLLQMNLIDITKTTNLPHIE